MGADGSRFFCADLLFSDCVVGLSAVLCGFGLKEPLLRLWKKS